MTEIEIKKEGKTINRYMSASGNAQAELISMVEGRPKGIDTKPLKISFQDYSYPGFSIQVEQFLSMDDCEVSSKCEVEPIMGFSLLTKGYLSANTSLFNKSEFNWQVGSANIVFRNGMGSMDMNIPKGETVEMVNFVIPQDYIGQLIVKDSETFGQLDNYTQNMENGTLFKENHLVNSQVMHSAMDIYNCRMLGNNAPIYLESKIAECIAGILSPYESLKGSVRLGLIMRDKMHDAEDIIRSHYQNMPSLHALATMVGTNECTLKKAFKQEFGTTVFQYLYDYRMNLAVKYLLDTSLPIADIGMKLGYDYQSHFCTAFKRKYGVSPMEFRMKG